MIRLYKYVNGHIEFNVHVAINFVNLALADLWRLKSLKWHLVYLANCCSRIFGAIWISYTFITKRTSKGQCIVHNNKTVYGTCSMRAKIISSLFESGGASVAHYSATVSVWKCSIYKGSVGRAVVVFNLHKSCHTVVNEHTLSMHGHKYTTLAIYVLCERVHYCNISLSKWNICG